MKQFVNVLTEQHKSRINTTPCNKLKIPLKHARLSIPQALPEINFRATKGQDHLLTSVAAQGISEGCDRVLSVTNTCIL